MHVTSYPMQKEIALTEETDLEEIQLVIE